MFFYNCALSYRETAWLCDSLHEKKLSCRREAARRAVSLEILLSCRLFEFTSLCRACIRSYMSLPCTVYEIFNDE